MPSKEDLARDLLKAFRDAALSAGSGPDSIWLYTEATRILEESMSTGKISVDDRRKLFSWNQDLHTAELVLKDRLDKIQRTKEALSKAFDIVLDVLIDQAFHAVKK